MFAREHKQEYDPTSSPMIERPLATGRPLSVQQGNAYGGSGPGSFRQGEIKKMPVNGPLRSPAKMNGIHEESISVSKASSSPTKSSMSSKSRYSQVHQAFDPETSIWSEEEEEEESAERQLPPGKSLHRHAKSVTFDAAPPQVNEYEMTTPDPSSVASGSREGSYESINEGEDESFDRDSSIERDDSFDASLEDTEKTPVVLPEDWRFMSPAVANEDLAAHVESPFDGEQSSPAPTTQPASTNDARVSPTRTDSVNSNGERRPLPPLPALGMPLFPRARADSNDSLSATTERVSRFQRVSSSSPRPASISKAEVQGMGGCSMAIEDRLRLMMIDDPDKRSSPVEEQQEQGERRLRRGSPLRGSDPEGADREIQIHEEEVENDDVADLGEYKLPPRISRESILRKVKSRNFNEPEDENSFLGLSPTSDIGVYNNLDPDTPIPSLETEVTEKEVVIKQEPDLEDSEVDVYSIPDLYSQQLQAESYMNAIEKLEAFRASSAQNDDDDESHYSVDSKESGLQERKSDSATDEGPPTPRALASNQAGQVLERKNSHSMSLPQFAALLGESDFGFSMESFMTPSPGTSQEPVKSVLSPQPSWTSDVPTEKSFLEQSIDRPVTPEEQLQPPRFPGQGNDSEGEPQTPDSVIRHPVAHSPVPDSPGVPEPVATIKAPGSKLKTRPSITPADVQAMAELRRQVSNGSQVPAVPKIPERHLSRPSIVAESDEPVLNSASEVASVPSLEERETPKLSKRKSSLLPLEVSVQASDGLGLGIESEFDRVIEAQKVAFNFPIPDMASRPWSPGHAEHMPGQEFRPFREGYANKAFRSQKGYLMRQNTKVIIASSASHESTESVTENKDTQELAARGTRSAGNSPRKPSHTQTWTAEPWNGKIRRKSIRKSGGVPSKAPGSGPAPPLPGQQSNVATGLGSVTEYESMQSTEEIGEDGERGRLFVKVVRVKDLDLPLPKGMIVALFLTSSCS